MPWNKKFVQTEIRNLPIAGCYLSISPSMHDAVIIVSRNYPNGRKAWVFFVVDLACKGLLGFDNHFDTSKKMLHKTLYGDRTLRFKQASYQRVHNIIFGAIKFGEYFGFNFNRKKWEKAKYILKEYKGEDLSQKFRFGIDGIPYYIPNYDESEEKQEEILNQLDKTAGTHGYKYVPRLLKSKLHVKFEADKKGLERMTEQEIFEEENRNIFEDGDMFL